VNTQQPSINTQQPGSQILLVPTKTLLLIASSVWMAAGASVVSVGLKAEVTGYTEPMLVGALVTFALFLVLFVCLARRNSLRIVRMKNRLEFILNFFDVSSYMVMVVMIFLGASVRLSTFVPEPIIAWFYCGLGAALVLSAFYPVIFYIQTWTHTHFQDQLMK